MKEVTDEVGWRRGQGVGRIREREESGLLCRKGAIQRLVKREPVIFQFCGAEQCGLQIFPLSCEVELGRHLSIDTKHSDM